MPLLQAYTISFVNRECDKVCIDFADPLPSDYERAELLRFFRKYKAETYIEHSGGDIFFLVVKWEHWLEFLFTLGFEDTARVTGEVLDDLKPNYEITMDDWVEQFKKAKPIKDLHKEKSVVADIIDEDDYERLKQQEIHRLRFNKVKKGASPEQEHDLNVRTKLKIPLL